MRLLIVGALAGQIGAASQIAMKRGAQVAHAPDINAALMVLRSGLGADLVMIDIKLDVGGLIESLKSERINTAVVACGVGNDTDGAVRAIRAGAKEYIPLPPDAEMIAAVIAAVAEESHSLIYRDPVMGAVLRLAEQVAPSEASILVTGESGSGKEIMARFIHRKSRRAKKQFIAVNCAAIPENLLESELFGHEKGAFTGAVARRQGKFEEASGGTLLLDEVSEMDPRLQAKLLRVIQERVVDRVGGSAPVKVDVRLIATSNRNLEEEVRKGTFREDLYFRLNVVNIKLPPLRERPLDIEALADFFVKKYSESNCIPLRKLSAEGRKALRGAHWRGNVRELENTMHRAVLLAENDEIGPEVILLSPSAMSTAAPAAAPAPAHEPKSPTASAAPPAAAGHAPAGDGETTTRLVGRTLEDVERHLIIDTLSHCLGNRTHAATILGISIRTLRNKLKLYSEQGVPVPLPGAGENAAY